MEKYASNPAYYRARAMRGALRLAIRPLARWRRMEQPEEGYSLVIAVYAPLAGLLPVNFDFLSRQDPEGLREVILAFDAPRSPELESIVSGVSAKLPVPVKALYRTRAQAAALRVINWGWVACWLNYVEGLAACRTRYAILHDMDAMLLDGQFLAKRYRKISGDAALKYLSIRWYEGNGIVPDDRVGYVVNMALDVASLRERHRPIDAFNRVGRLDGRRVEWDTLLWPQQVDRATQVMPVHDGWVHPSQVASQHMYLRREGHYRPTRPCNLPWVPYLLDLSGEAGVLERHRAALAESPSERVPFLGGTIDFTGHVPEQTDWTAQQMTRLETALFGEVRPAVRGYIEALRRHERNGR